MKKSHINILVLLLIYVVILVGLFLPYSYGLSHGKVVFAYQSTPSTEFKNRFDTTYLGIQTIFGMYNLVLVIILTFTRKAHKDLRIIIILFIIYLLSLFFSHFLNSFSGIGGPFPDSFLTGRSVLITGTLALFIFYFQKAFQEVQKSKIDKFK